MKPNFIVILIDDLRYDEFGAGGHPYMQTPNIDRLAQEGALFERAFHTTPICSPNRASIMTGQCASRHGVIVCNQDFHCRPGVWRGTEDTGRR